MYQKKVVRRVEERENWLQRRGPITKLGNGYVSTTDGEYGQEEQNRMIKKRLGISGYFDMGKKRKRQIRFERESI